uniref:Glycerol uptake protein 2 n=1 Tax=Lygus hesperus TaxID=30085 RepID=A0A0A9Z625_LYGHE
MHEYSLLSYLAYLYYPPLFVAGPMISFNSYMSFLHHPQRSVRGKDLKRYIYKVVFNAIFLFTMMHYIYIMALLLTKPPKHNVFFNPRDFVSTSTTTSALHANSLRGENEVAGHNSMTSITTTTTITTAATSTSENEADWVPMLPVV